MKVGIIQLSDLHIQSGDDYIVKNAKALADGCKSIINTCNKVVVVVTGDIIDKGNVDNYAHAEKMLNTIKSELMKEAPLESYEYVFVPGNHDIDFKSEEDVRPVVINEIQSRDVVEEKQFIEICLKPQQRFWEFVSKMEGIERKPCVSYSKVTAINDNCSLVFHCYNSALLSTIQEQPQQLIIPENYFIDYNAIDDNRKDIVISIFHHKTGWLSTRTANNNQHSFCQHVEKTSQVLMCGHEHQRGHKVISDLENVDKILYLESDSLQQGDEQSFEVLTIDDKDGTIFHPYEIVLVKDGLIDIIEEPAQEVKFKKHALSFTQKYNSYLSKLEAPIKHPVKKDLVLDDIFIYPDLEPLATLDHSKMYPYVDSINLIKNTSQGNIVILEGESQCGKTSLLKMLVRQCYQNGVYPILIKGDAMNVINLNGILKDAYSRQYEGKNMGYNQYLQMERQKRVVFIDNLDKSSLNQEGIKQAFKQVLDNYDFIVATAATDNSVIGLLQKSRNDSDIKRYMIHPLGYVKRNQLIERWILLGADQQTMKTNMVADKINSIFNMFSNILGKQLMPSNPIFLLILLQEVNIALEPYDVEPTSYASLYRSLLMSALHKQDVPHNRFDGIILFLSMMAYNFYKTRIFTIKKDYQVDGEVGFSQFYDGYIKDWNMPYTKDKLLDILINSQILSEKEPDCYCFAYKYIYFYLVANYISSIKDEKHKMDEVKHLCSKLYKEEHGNILIFMSYLVNDPYLMEEIKFASWLPFEDREPITLERTDVLYQRLEEVVNSVSNEVLRTDVDHTKMRQKMLEAKDKNLMAENQGRQEVYKPTDEDFEKDKNLRDINNMLKANRIIGQIIKNQRDTLPKDQIVDMLTDAYLASFRTLSFFTDLLKTDQSDIVNDLIAKDENLRKLGIKEVTDRINALFQMMLMRTCLITFSNLTLSVGTPGIKALYDKVAREKIKTPAADVITFSIKSYFEPMRDDDLEDIVKKYKNNPVVINIIRARVRNYVYTHNLPHDRMQRIGSISGMKLINSPSRLLAKKNR